MRNAIIRILQALVIVAVVCSFAHADQEFVYFKKKAVAGGASCSPSPTGDELTEGFENTSGSSGYSANTGTWTQTGSTIDNQATLTSAPTNSCTKGVQYNTSGAVAYSLWNAPSPLANNIAITYSAEFYVTAISQTAFTTTRVMGFGATDIAADGTSLSYVQVNNDGGTYQIRCNSTGGNTSTYVNITTATWYRMTVAMDAAGAAAASTCQLDTWNGSSWNSGSANTFTRYVSGSARGTFVQGPYFGFGAGESANITFGYVYISTP